MGRINHSFITHAVRNRIGSRLLNNYARRVFIPPPPPPIQLQQNNPPPQNFKPQVKTN
jgi:hypothetical protein